MPCLGTSTLIDLLKAPHHELLRRASAAVQRRVAAGREVTTTRVCEAELRTGVYLAPDPTHERRRVERLLSPLVMLEVTSEAADQFGRIKAYLRGIGRPVGDLDVLIAAMALCNGQGILTRNPRHFAAIPGLGVETY